MKQKMRELIKSEYSHWLRRTTIRIPEEMRSVLPNNDTMRIGYNTLHGLIILYLIPRNGSGVEEIVATIPCEASPGTNYVSDIEYVNECRRIAADETVLTEILKGYVAGKDLEVQGMGR